MSRRKLTGTRSTRSGDGMEKDWSRRLRCQKETPSIHIDKRPSSLRSAAARQTLCACRCSRPSSSSVRWKGGQMLSIQMNADSIGYLRPLYTLSDSKTALPSLSAPLLGLKVEINPCYYHPSCPLLPSRPSSRRLLPPHRLAPISSWHYPACPALFPHLSNIPPSL